MSERFVYSLSGNAVNPSLEAPGRASMRATVPESEQPTHSPVRIHISYSTTFPSKSTTFVLQRIISSGNTIVMASTGQID